jgi:hypothetical protein
MVRLAPGRILMARLGRANSRLIANVSRAISRLSAACHAAPATSTVATPPANVASPAVRLRSPSGKASSVPATPTLWQVNATVLTLIRMGANCALFAEDIARTLRVCYSVVVQLVSFARRAMWPLTSNVHCESPTHGRYGIASYLYGGAPTCVPAHMTASLPDGLRAAQTQ